MFNLLIQLLKGHISDPNTSMSWAKVTSRRVKSCVVLSEEQNNIIKKKVDETRLEKEKVKNPANINNLAEEISLEEKNRRVREQLQIMSRTLGLRVWHLNLIDLTLTNMKSRNNIDPKVSLKDQRAKVMKTIVRAFMTQDLHMTLKEYSEVNIESLEQEERDNSDIINVRFKTIADISKVNSKFVNLDVNNRNKVYQYVPNPLKNRYLAFETAAHQIRSDNNNQVNTKIRPGKQDFILLVRPKFNKTPWSQISQTFTPINMNANFEVGNLNKADKERRYYIIVN